MPYREQELVFAKLKGFPSWPARIMPYNAELAQANKKKNMYQVAFIDAKDNVETDQTGLCPPSEIFPWAEVVENMKAASQNKGGKTYMDLRACIEKGDRLHKDFVAKLEKDPTAFKEVYPYNPSGNAEQSAGDSAPKKGKGAGKGRAAMKNGGSLGTTEKVILPKLVFKTLPAVDESEGTSVEPKRTKRVAKKREAEEISAPVPAKRQAKQKAVTTPVPTPAPVAQNTSVTPQKIEQAKHLKVGFIGLEDPRTKELANKALIVDMSVYVWSEDDQISKSMEYSQAERVSDPEKMFEEADVVFVSAQNGRDLHDLISGSHHLVRKIRPQAKGGYKGVCVFGAVSKQESIDLARKLEAKNLQYLECAWVGYNDKLKLVASRSEELFNHIKPIIDVLTKESVFLGPECGQALIVGSAASIAESVALSGLLEAAFFARHNSISLDTLFTLFPQFKDAGYESLVGDVLSGNVETAKDILQRQYESLRVAVQMAHPPTGPSSVTHMASFALDMFNTQFQTYHLKRSPDAPFGRSRFADNGSGVSGSGMSNGTKSEPEDLGNPAVTEVVSTS